MIFSGSPTSLSLIPADFDGNGIVDYLLLNSSKNFYDVRGIYVDAYPAFGTPDDVRIIDFNGDKKQEMLVEFSSKIPQSSLLTPFSSGQTLSSSYTYGAHGTDSTITYPGGFQIKKLYQNGYLREIQSSNGTLIWRLDSVSPFGGPKKYTLGTNGLLTRFVYYDQNGYLQKKTTGIRQQTFNFDTITGNLVFKGLRKGAYYRYESYSYDNLDRLTETFCPWRGSFTASYSSNGNIVSRTGTGSYYYKDDRINAIDSIANSTTILPGPQDIEYTYFNKVSYILDSIDKDLYSLSITYGPDQQRVKNVFGKNGDVIKTKYYSPGFEKEVTTSTTMEISYISSPYGLVAINIRQNSTDSLYFVDTDHLGSIMALIRNNGTQAAEYSYDEWGMRRRPTNWARYDTIPNIGFIDRGYTGHEHYDIFGIIDMNGRVYDPVIGRFLSPDPYIQSPDFTQSYNSYSYCMNNPLKFADFNGYNITRIPPENWGALLRAATEPGANADALAKEFGDKEWANYYSVHDLCYGGITGLNSLLSDRFGEQYNEVFNNKDTKPRYIILPGFKAPVMLTERVISSEDLAIYIRENFILPTTKGLTINPFFKAEAMFYDGGFNFVGTGKSRGGFFVLAGKSKGTFLPYNENFVGMGTAAGLSFEVGRLDASMNPEEFTPNLLYGIRNKGWISWGPGVLSVGGSFAQSRTRTITLNAYSIQVGIGLAPLWGWDLGYNYGNISH